MTSSIIAQLAFLTLFHGYFGPWLTLEPAGWECTITQYRHRL